MKFLVAFMLVLTLLHSATISGTVYSYDYFEPLDNAIVSFHGPAEYQVLAKDGNYSINLPPGQYNVSSLQYRNGSLEYMVKETLFVGDENQTFDLVAFAPVFFENDELPDLNLNFEAAREPAQDYTVFYAAAALAALAIAFFLLKGRLAGTQASGARTEPEMGGDEKDVLRMLAENEGRMGQRELRGILKYSESKMSLILTELEVTGRIKRFKKGRENIIKLRKGV